MNAVEFDDQLNVGTGASFPSVCDAKVFDYSCGLSVCIVRLLICVSGIAGNVGAIVLLKNERAPVVIRTMLQGLSGANICCLVASLYVTVLPDLLCFMDESPLVLFASSIQTLHAAHSVPEVAHRFMQFAAASVTVLRYRAVQKCGPTRPSRRCVCGLYIMSAVAAVLSAVPQLLGQELQPVEENNTTNGTSGPLDEALLVHVAVPGTLRGAPWLLLIGSVTLLFAEVLPVSLIAVAGCRLVRFLRVISSATRVLALRSTPSKYSEKRLKRTIAATVGVLTLCELPTIVADAWDAAALLQGESETAPAHLRTVARLLVDVNASMNLLIYLLSSDRVRKSLRRHFCVGNAQQRLRTNTFIPPSLPKNLPMLPVRLLYRSPVSHIRPTPLYPGVRMV